MKVREIITTASRSAHLDKYSTLFKDAKKTNAVNNLEFAVAIDSWGVENYGLFSEDELVSLVVISKRDLIYYQIEFSGTNVEFQRQGCFRYLLMKILDQHTNIASDMHQTPEAKNAWLSLIEYPSGRIAFSMYNTETTKLEKLDVNTCWNPNMPYVLIASNSHVTEHMIESCRIRDIYTRKHNRHFEGLWFGPESSNDVYSNP